MRLAPARSTAKPALRPAARIINAPSHASGAAGRLASDALWSRNAACKEASTPAAQRSVTTAAAERASPREMNKLRKDVLFFKTVEARKDGEFSLMKYARFARRQKRPPRIIQ